MPWKTYSGTPIEEPIVLAVERIILRFKESGQRIKICIGTDSQVKGKTIDMVTVIVFYVIGNGGFMFVNKQRLTQRMNMRERMMAEVTASIETGWELNYLLKRLDVEMEIHADINQDPMHQSYLAYHDAMGYTKGMGFTFKSKPDAFASSVCADRLCH
jgi:predicted RNase H-related nuclease YkuK (DUF458 family)